MPRSKRHVRRNRRPLEKLLPVVLVLLAATVSWRLWQRAHSAAQLLDQAKRTLESKRYAAVEELCKGISLNSPYSAEALLLAAEAASRQDHLRDALAYYDQIQGDAGEQAVSARCAAGEVWLHLGHASKAEAEYRDALTIHPEATVAHERLAGLLALEGRRFESLPHLYELLRQRRHSYDILFLAGQHAKMIEVPDELARLRAAAPDDPAPLIGLARIEMRKQKFEPAAKLLKQVIAQDPGYIEAHALVGRILLEGPDDDELAAWDAALPPDADWHPDIWAVRGGGARRRGEMQAAARCLWEALRRDANHHSATLQLSQVLESLGESKMAEGLGRRAAALSDFAVTLELLFKHPDDLSLIYQAARQAETVGRLWEAWGWNKTALTVASDARWAQEALARIEPQLTDELPPTLALVDPGVQLDLSHYPFPAEHGGTGSTSTPFSPGEASPSFNDIAREAGIDFTYFCGREGTNPRARMFESLGGGIAVVDYDLDGWPDLYFTQGCRWPPRAGQREYLDAMYRNVANGHFSDVTHVSRLGDDRFSQGATVGDFNDDGFPDLYVANIGVNRLYVNNGDGTFSDVGEAAGIYADRWTTSCLLADLNGDGLPDLYDVNYLQGPDVFERTCSVNGEPRTCRPSTFEPAPDMLFFNLGDGRFEEMTESVGLRASGGNGLGIVASNFGSGRLNLFIANDQDA
ncbi:MAG TPA: FG-GAP-like repeat-containing protein, partial [Pirellulales bacterium]|nr:FG-GAP-like repeat-containing protein [Pirellulales bacterium]